MRDKNGLGNIIKTVVWPIAIYYLVHQMAAIFLLQILENVGLNKEGNLWGICARMLAMILAGLAVVPFYHRTEGKRNLAIRNVIFVLMAGAIFSLGLNYLFFITGLTGSSETYTQVAQAQFSYALFPALVFYGVVSPMVEELVFRGIVYSSLKENTSKVFAVIFSALLFGAIHGNLVQMLYGTIMGGIMAILYEKYKNLLAPVFFHGAANVAIYICTYPVS